MSTATVLVVEHDENVRTLLGDMLESVGCNAVLAPDGAAAVQVAQMRRFDVAFIDAQMPRHDALATLRRLRELRSDAHYVVISGMRNGALERQCLQQGAAAVLYKPVDLATLETLIKDLLEASEGTSPP
jgi:CheY-like chemotaxis protein